MASPVLEQLKQIVRMLEALEAINAPPKPKTDDFVYDDTHEGTNMATVNALTDAGQRLLARVDDVRVDLVAVEAGPMNDAVNKLTDIVRDLILNTVPLWEKQEA